jgi:hypothetical protein
MEFANYLNQLEDHLPAYTEKQRFHHLRIKLRVLIQNALNMQIAEPICNRKHLISTITRLKKVLSKNKRSKITAPPNDFNDHRPSYFNRSKERISNNFIPFRRSVMASINNNRYIHNNISGRSQNPRRIFEEN